MSSPGSRLWLALRFIDLPLAALKLDDAHTKAIVVTEKKGVVYANPLAQEAGASVGMDATTAQVVSGCEVVARDKEKEQQSLHELSEQLYQFSPHIDHHCSVELAQSALLLEISSCLRLFGGLKLFTDKVFGFLDQTRFMFSYGLAHSAKAAWYLSFEHYEVTGDESRPVFIERLNTLGIELFFDYPKAAQMLGKTGFKTFGDLAIQIKGHSISSFRKRVGMEFTEMLCEVYDIDQDFMQQSLFSKPRDTYTPEEHFEEEIQFEYPVTIVDQLKPAIESLLQQLSDYLRKRQQQCQRIDWLISDIYRKKESLTVNSDTPQSHWQLLYDLSLIQFDNKDLPFEVDTIKLECFHTTPLQHRTQILDFDQTRRRKNSAQDFSVTIAKLKARLGDTAVYKMSYCDSRVPELTNVFVSLATRSNQELPSVHAKSLRPTWLLTQPELIEERNDRLYWHGYLSTQVGPERIIGNWWSEPVARDYYLAKRHDNLPVWIFFNLYDKKWYVHGVFA